MIENEVLNLLYVWYSDLCKNKIKIKLNTEIKVLVKSVFKI